jgi:ribonucleoside-diphosphate reductase alpha chain
MDKIGANISGRVWEAKYRYHGENVMADSWRRIASALAAVERQDAAVWEQRFFGILDDFKFLPGGRIQAGAGTKRNVTLFNCFVMGMIEDSIPRHLFGLGGGSHHYAAGWWHRLRFLYLEAAR